MEQILIPHKRAVVLGSMLESLCKRLECSIEIRDGNEVLINGDAYSEYNARNVIHAFGRGFDIKKALRLLDDEYFFRYISLKEAYRNAGQMKRIKARLIGEHGRVREYIEEVSGAYIEIWGDTIGIIGKVEEISVAVPAIEVLMEGGTHKKAYRVMDAVRRKLERGA